MIDMVDNRRMILASASAIRAKLLQNAGYAFAIQPTFLDEEVIKNTCLNDGLNPKATALKLAEAKALSINDQSLVQGSQLVIGSDQILEFQSKILSKARSQDEAIERLKILNGQSHDLHSAVAISLDGDLVWSHVETVGMTMRRMTDQEIKLYGQKAGITLIHTVGGYAYEDIGIHLFDEIDGDYHALLGFPLLPLLKALRHYGFGLN